MSHSSISRSLAPPTQMQAYEVCQQAGYKSEKQIMKVTADANGKTWQLTRVPRDELPTRTSTTDLQWKVTHNRMLSWDDDFMGGDQANYEKRYVSRVWLRISADSSSSSSSSSDGYALNFCADIDVNIRPATSTHNSSTREGTAHFTVGCLPPQHPLRGKRFVVTVVQQSRARGPDGAWLWGKDVAIRCINIEPEQLEKAMVSVDTFQSLNVADNEVPIDQQSDDVRHEEARLVENSEPEAQGRVAAAAAAAAEPKFERSHVASVHSFKVKVRKIWTDGCSCGDDMRCKFCKGVIPGYSRVDYAGSRHIAEEAIGTGRVEKPPLYDPDGNGSADTILQVEQCLTTEGMSWLKSFWPVGDLSIIPPKYAKRWIDIEGVFKRAANTWWLATDDRAVPIIIGRILDIEALRAEEDPQSPTYDEAEAWERTSFNFHTVTRDLVHVESMLASRLRADGLSNETMMTDLLKFHHVRMRKTFGRSTTINKLRDQCIKGMSLLDDCRGPMHANTRSADVRLIRKMKAFYEHINQLHVQTSEYLLSCQRKMMPRWNEELCEDDALAAHSMVLRKMVRSVVDRAKVPAWQKRALKRADILDAELRSYHINAFRYVDRDLESSISAVRRMSWILSLEMHITFLCVKLLEDTELHYEKGCPALAPDNRDSQAEEEAFFRRTMKAFQSAWCDIDLVCLLCEKIDQVAQGCHESPLEMDEVHRLEFSNFRRSLEETLTALEQGDAGRKDDIESIKRNSSLAWELENNPWFDCIARDVHDIQVRDRVMQLPSMELRPLPGDRSDSPATASTVAIATAPASNGGGSNASHPSIVATPNSTPQHLLAWEQDMIREHITSQRSHYSLETVEHIMAVLNSEATRIRSVIFTTGTRPSLISWAADILIDGAVTLRNQDAIAAAFTDDSDEDIDMMMLEERYGT